MSPQNREARDSWGEGCPGPFAAPATKVPVGEAVACALSHQVPCPSYAPPSHPFTLPGHPTTPHYSRTPAGDANLGDRARACEGAGAGDRGCLLPARAQGLPHLQPQTCLKSSLPRAPDPTYPPNYINIAAASLVLALTLTVASALRALTLLPETQSFISVNNIPQPPPPAAAYLPAMSLRCDFGQGQPPATSGLLSLPLPIPLLPCPW